MLMMISAAEFRRHAIDDATYAAYATLSFAPLIATLTLRHAALSIARYHAYALLSHTLSDAAFFACVAFMPLLRIMLPAVSPLVADFDVDIRRAAPPDVALCYCMIHYADYAMMFATDYCRHYAYFDAAVIRHCRHYYATIRRLR